MQGVTITVDLYGLETVAQSVSVTFVTALPGTALLISSATPTGLLEFYLFLLPVANSFA